MGPASSAFCWGLCAVLGSCMNCWHSQKLIDTQLWGSNVSALLDLVGTAGIPPNTLALTWHLGMERCSHAARWS